MRIERVAISNVRHTSLFDIRNFVNHDLLDKFSAHSIQSLDISYSRFNDDMMIYLCELFNSIELSNLRHLDLRGNTFSHIGLERLLKTLEYNTSLSGMDLRCNSNVKQEKCKERWYKFLKRNSELSYLGLDDDLIFLTRRTGFLRSLEMNYSITCIKIGERQILNLKELGSDLKLYSILNRNRFYKDKKTKEILAGWILKNSNSPIWNLFDKCLFSEILKFSSL
jgi:hypothetical protein